MIPSSTRKGWKQVQGHFIKKRGRIPSQQMQEERIAQKPELEV
jgi:hypothetical protein